VIVLEDREYAIYIASLELLLVPLESFGLSYGLRGLCEKLHRAAANLLTRRLVSTPIEPTGV
jgi:hypothetical protein